MAGDPYEQHFGAVSTLVTEAKRESVDQRSWGKSRAKSGKLGSVVEYTPGAEKGSHPQNEYNTSVSAEQSISVT